MGSLDNDFGAVGTFIRMRLDVTQIASSWTYFGRMNGCIRGTTGIEHHIWCTAFFFFSF